MNFRHLRTSLLPATEGIGTGKVLLTFYPVARVSDRDRGAMGVRLESNQSSGIKYFISIIIMGGIPNFSVKRFILYVYRFFCNFFNKYTNQ